MARREGAREVGADFVDLKHCHGYLLHEFLGAHTREGKFGGSFANRAFYARSWREFGRKETNRSCRALEHLDMVPHRPDPELSTPGKLGPGIPEEHTTPYPYQFGVNPDDPTPIDLRGSCVWRSCGGLGIKLLNTTAGSPYYTPHLQPGSVPAERRLSAVRSVN